MIAITQQVIALYALSWTSLKDWSLYFQKNVRIKKGDSRNPTELVRVRSKPY